jgi:hypothetical protein
LITEKSSSYLLEHSTKRPKLTSQPSDQDLGITLEFAPSHSSPLPVSSSSDNEIESIEKASISRSCDAKSSTEALQMIASSSPPESMETSPLSASPKKTDKFSFDTHDPRESSKLNEVLSKQLGLGVKASQLMRNLNIKEAQCKYWFYEGQWFCRIEYILRGQAFFATSQPDIRNKLLALKYALEKFSGILHTYSKEMKRNDFRNLPFQPPNAKAESLKMRDIQIRIAAIQNTPPAASISTAVSAPLPASPINHTISTAADPRKVDKITSPLSRKPILPRNSQDYMMANLPDLTVSSLKKWLQDPRNFDRLNQIQIENQELVRLRINPARDPVLDVNAEALENSSRVLLDDLYAYNGSELGSQMLVYRNCLPISSCKDELLNQIGGNQVVIISGETGMGKSTQVPNYILEQMTINGFGSQCNVIVVVSTVWCGIGLAKRGTR